jgi:hypothetical protein
MIYRSNAGWMLSIKITLLTCNRIVTSVKKNCGQVDYLLSLSQTLSDT